MNTPPPGPVDVLLAEAAAPAMPHELRGEAAALVSDG